VSAGLPPGLFWRLTPREVFAQLQGAGRRLEREQGARAWLAHTIGVLGRIDPKRFPKLEDLTGQPLPAPEPQRQSLEEMMLAVQAWDSAVNARKT
tara:strand:+ start:227 stop:511 length:285 start_codon:yes stop_codon:yes gene_type:complete